MNTDKNYKSFESFKDAAASASVAFVKPYGLYFRGEVYWDKKLPRKPGSRIRFVPDNSAPWPSLLIFNLDGGFLCTANPVSWHENDHSSQHEMTAWFETLSDEERLDLELPPSV